MEQEPDLRNESTPRAADVTAVVLVHNAQRALARTLECLDQQTVQPGRVIVVDNASTDGSRTGLEERSGLDIVLLDENVGVGAGHTVGWSRALADSRCQWVWVLEHDTFATPTCLEMLLDAVAHLDGQLGALQARPERDESEATLHEIPGVSVLEQPIMTFNGVLIPRSTIDTVGFPRADFFVGQEDWDYSRRLRSAGGKIMTVMNALAFHPTRGDNRYGLRPTVLRSYYSNRNWFYERRFERKEPLITVRALAWTLGATVKTLVTEDQKARRTAARLVALRDGLSGRLGRREYWFLKSGRT